MTIARNFYVNEKERQTVLERGRNCLRNFRTIVLRSCDCTRLQGLSGIVLAETRISLQITRHLTR